MVVALASMEELREPYMTRIESSDSTQTARHVPKSQLVVQHTVWRPQGHSAPRDLSQQGHYSTGNAAQERLYDVEHTDHRTAVT